MDNTGHKTVRLIVLVDPGLRAQVAAKAREPQYQVNGQPSLGAVVRAALECFFASLVHYDEQ